MNNLEIGVIQNDVESPEKIRNTSNKTSTIIIKSEYLDGFKGIEGFVFLDIVFYFHLSQDYQLITNNHTGETRGVFATRSPNRPNSIGVTTVRMIKIEGNRLFVSGLDAVNGTPVLDIKPCDNSIFEDKENNDLATVTRLKSNPRADIIKHIKNQNTERLLLDAGRIHGHFCPGLAMGVMAAVKASQSISEMSDGMEDVIAITETNNCFSDGVQYVTGCTFGNNALIYKDIGKTAFTLATRNGNAVRICSKHESRTLINHAFPDFEDLYQQVVTEQNHDEKLKTEFKKAGIQRSFGTLGIPVDDLFTISHEKVDIPEYASIHNSFVCDQCGESVMGSRILKKGSKHYCYVCANHNYNSLSGNGISAS